MWLILAFCSAALLGFYDVSKKKSLADNAVIPVLLLNTLFCSLIFLPFVAGSAVGILPQDSLFYVPAVSLRDHILLFLKAILVLSSWIFGYFGIKHLPLTIVGPIHATRPVMVLMGAVAIFGEKLNWVQWAGVLAACLSFFMLSRSGRKEGIRFSRNRWIWFIVLAAFLGALSALYDKYLLMPSAAGGLGMDKMVVQSWYNFYQFLLMLIILLILWLPRRSKEAPFQWRWSILFISIFLSAADFLYFYALSQPDSMISIVSMVRRGSVVVSFAVGALLFHERNIRSKLIDLSLVILSMILLWIGTIL